MTGFLRLEGITLPVYSRRADDLTLFYAPGFLAAARDKEAAEIRGVLAGELPFGENMTPHYLMDAARSAQDRWRMVHDPDNYDPVCMTVYSSMACNLRCAYCFSENERKPVLPVSSNLIKEYADHIIRKTCIPKKETFTAVFHGGGEPSLDKRLPAIVKILRQMCMDAGVPFHSYIATNGVMEVHTAELIAERFDEIGLSVDGPPDIQNSQRPLRDGKDSSAFVERTAAVFKEKQGGLSVRVTVLPENFPRIAEISDYCMDVLNADTIRLEPVYIRGTDRRTEADRKLADVFCSHFLHAKKRCSERHVSLLYSGSRIREIHGRYCNIFRQVIQFVPRINKGLDSIPSMDGFNTSSCFAVSTIDQSERENPGSGMRYRANIFKRLSAEDPDCVNCFNRCHCARGCPDSCPLLFPEPRDAGSFRCIVNRTLAEAELRDLAGKLLADMARQYGYAGMKLREI